VNDAMIKFCRNRHSLPRIASAFLFGPRILVFFRDFSGNFILQLAQRLGLFGPRAAAMPADNRAMGSITRRRSVTTGSSACPDDDSKTEMDGFRTLAITRDCQPRLAVP
jgi:hypothetical protein